MISVLKVLYLHVIIILVIIVKYSIYVIVLKNFKYIIDNK